MKTSRNAFSYEKSDAVFARKLRILFAQSGMTHGNLADYIKECTGDSVTRQAIGQWCNGNTCPNLKTVPLIASFFGVSVEYLLTETDIKSAKTDLKAVCEYTGLSEECTSILNQNSKDKNKIWNDIINSFVIHTRDFQSMNTQMLDELMAIPPTDYTRLKGLSDGELENAESEAQRLGFSMFSADRMISYLKKQILENLQAELHQAYYETISDYIQTKKGASEYGSNNPPKE